MADTGEEGGKNVDMIVLSDEQIKQMGAAMDDILSPKGKTVADIKKKHDLTSEEYNMIFDLTMPLIRKGNGAEYWKTLYINMRGNLYERLQQEKPGNTLAIDICQILENSTVGRRKKKRKQAKEIMNALNEA